VTNSRINELDFLRFIAVLGIVFFHYAFRGYAADSMSVMPYPWLAPAAKYGVHGLEMLFLISGFVIAMTAANRSLRHFVISRFVRLYPTFWVCCTITFVAILATGAPRYSATFWQYLVNMTMLSEFFRVPSIDGVYWFLCVEILFYGAVAMAVFLAGMQRFQWFLIAWLAIEVLLELLPIGRNPARMLADYSVCFIAGAEFFLIWSSGLSFTRVAMVVATMALAIVQEINRLPAFEKHYDTIIDRNLVGGAIVVMFIVMMLIALRRTGPLARTRWVLPSAISYPLFLLHENIGFMIFNKLYPAINPHVLLWGTFALMIAVSLAIHLVIERRLSATMTAALNRLAA
jgi:peptidoglycan/LPS O-acetylase OafA/YrhL